MRFSVGDVTRVYKRGVIAVPDLSMRNDVLGQTWNPHLTHG